MTAFRSNRRQLLQGLASVGLSSVLSIPGATAQIRGDRLVIGQTGDIVSLDPAFRVDTLTGIVQKNVYQTVLNRMPDMSVGPGVASSYERVAPDKWRLILREGLTFSNGEKVDAEAVRFTIERLNADATRSPIKSFFATLKRIEIQSAHELTIQTEGLDALFLARMTNLQLVPPRYTAEAATRFADAPIGSGPYTVERWRRNEDVTLNARTDLPPQRFAKLIFRPIPEEIARISAVRTGEAHIVTALSPNQADSLIAQREVQVLKADSNRVMVVQFNKEVEPGNNPRFREAVGLAINRDEIIRGLLRGYATPVRTIYSSSIQGVPQGVTGDFPHDPARARQIIDELGLRGREIELSGAAGRYPLDRETALAIGAQLRRIGLNVRVRTEEYGAFANRIKNNTVGPVFIQPHGNVWLDPLPQIIAFFYSRGHWSGWRDPALDAMIDAANRADGAERERLVGDLIRKLRDDAIAVPLFAHQFIYAAVPGLRWQPRADDLIVVDEIA